MELALGGVALGLLFGAAKILLIGTAGFGIAWWRAKRRIQKLEALRAEPSLTGERLDRLEQGLDYLASQLDRVVEGQADLLNRIGAERPLGELPAARPVTPH